jgi:hypothetical protein
VRFFNRVGRDPEGFKLFNSKFRLAISLWQRVPLFVSRRLRLRKKPSSVSRLFSEKGVSFMHFIEDIASRAGIVGELFSFF